MPVTEVNIFEDSKNGIQNFPIRNPHRTTSFRFDALNRKPSVEALSNLLNSLTGPFVLTIDSPWGTGKTTFIKIWKAYLESQGFACLYFNAWETDFSTDPLVAFLSEFDSLEKSFDFKHENFSKFFDKARRSQQFWPKRHCQLLARLQLEVCLISRNFHKKLSLILSLILSKMPWII